LAYIDDVLAKFEILVAMVYVVAGLLVVGGVQSDETDRLWSEALLLLLVSVTSIEYSR
jgi:hypothetical protein